MRLTHFLALAALSAPGAVYAEVADSSAAGFAVKTTVSIAAAPMEVYRSVFRIGEWWSSEHTWSGDSKNLRLEEKPMGCFCETLPKGGAVRHMEVINFAPGEKVVLTGGLGPLQAMAAIGTMSLSLSPDGTGTKLEMTYAVAGYLPGGLGPLAPVVDKVLLEQMTRLKDYIEKERPASK